MKSISFQNTLLYGAFILLIVSCKHSSNEGTIAIANTISLSELTIERSSTIKPSIKDRSISQEFKDYWYAGKAEITSYKLEQGRYGEVRPGTAVMIYVTEDFLPEVQVKADRQNQANIPVLKLNATKNFHTGVYPYSIMSSTFYPVYKEQHALKVSQSMQEWCGQQYAQLNNREAFEIKSHSYFEGEADKEYTVPKTHLENELWIQLRINPENLPTGSIEIIPDFSYSRLKHVPLKAYTAKASHKEGRYILEYPELKRSLVINYSPEFPFTINSWEETFKSGFGPNAKELTSRATKINTIKSAYWGKNSNKDTSLREELGLN